MGDNSTEIALDWFNYYSLCSSVLIIIICLVGIVTNAISVTVFLQKSFRHLSINLLLAALSCADLFMLLLSLPVFVPGPLSAFFPVFTQMTGFASVYLYPFTKMFHCASVWLLGLVSFERWFAVCQPLYVGVYCTRKRAILAIACVVVVSIAFNTCRFWEFKYMSGEPKKRLRANSDYMLWYITIGTLLFIYLIPLLLMVSFNIHIGMEISKSRKMNQKMSSVHKVARMLFYVVLAFTFCYTFSLALNLWETLKPSFFETNVGFAISDLSNIFIVANSASTFFFYFNFSSRYRQAVHELFARRESPTENLSDTYVTRGKSNKYLRRMQTLGTMRVKFIPPSLDRRLSESSVFTNTKASFLTKLGRYRPPPENMLKEEEEEDDLVFDFSNLKETFL